MGSFASNWLPALAAVAACFLSGAAWLSLARFPWRSGPEGAGYSFAAGAAWLGVFTMALAPLGGVAGGAVQLAGLALPVVLLVLLRRPLRPAGEPGAGWKGFLPCLLVVALGLWFAAVRPVWNVDALARWVLHGQWLAETGSLTPDLVRDPAWAFTHPRYPPLIPSLVGLALELGADKNFGIRPMFPFFFLALLGVFHGHARRWAGAGPAAWVTLAFALTPCFATADRYNSAGGLGSDAAMADIPLALFLTGLVVLLLEAREERDDTLAAGAAWMAAGAALTKQEGVAAAALTILLLAAAAGLRPGGDRRALRRMAWPAAAFVAATAAWALLSRSLPVMEGENYLSLESAGAFFEGLERLPVVLARFLDELVLLPVWGPLWAVPPVVLAAWVIGTRRAENASSRRMALALGLLLLALLTLILAAFLISGWRRDDYAALMEVSLTRLLMHHAPLAGLLLCHLPRLPGRPAAGRTSGSRPA